MNLVMMTRICHNFIILTSLRQDFEWIQDRPRQSLFLSVLTLGKIRKGIERLGDLACRQKLLDWLEVELPNYFVGRMLTIDARAAERWAV